MTTEDNMIIDLSESSPPPESNPNPELSLRQPEYWDIKIRAALAMLPPLEETRLRTKFMDGLALEYSHVASLAGTATILGLPAAVPFLVKGCAAFLMLDDNNQIEALDELKGIAFKDGMKPTDIDQGRWKEEWWNELEAASFPCQDYSSHKRRQQKLLERLRSVQALTRLAHDKNTENLDLRAKELKKLSKGYQMMQDLLMPGKEERSGMMEDMYQRESEGGRHAL